MNKNLLKFVSLQLLVPSAIFALGVQSLAVLYLLFSDPFSPSFWNGLSASSYAVLVITMVAMGIGTLPCLIFGFLTQRTFTNVNFKKKSMSYWFLSYLITMTFWTVWAGRGTGELPGDYFISVVFGIIAAKTWSNFSQKYLVLGSNIKFV